MVGDDKLSVVNSFLLTQVADFGLASTDGATIDSGKLPIKWTAPEVKRLTQDLETDDIFDVSGSEAFSFLQQI